MEFNGMVVEVTDEYVMLESLDTGTRFRWTPDAATLLHVRSEYERQTAEGETMVIGFGD